MEATMSDPRSTASIAGHPIHPMLIPFPIAFFVSTFVCDLAYWQSANSAWATAATWLLGAGLVMAALAALAGLTDVIGEPRIRRLNDVWWHAGGNVLVVLIELYTGDRINPSTRFGPFARRRLHSVVHRLEGWEMVYRHRVGVADAEESPVGVTRPTRRAARQRQPMAR
jgi:uncharacterized membrane protein